MSYQIIKEGNITWSWKVFGQGPKILMAFHGFNRSPDDFQPFEKYLGREYTILAFDLFFHGKSTVTSENGQPVLTYVQLQKLIDGILEMYHARDFEIMAYSFGGRIALNCVAIYESRMKGLYLMAPDGLRFNPGYWFAVQTGTGRYLFRKNTKDPKAVIRIMRLLPALGLYNKKAMDAYINHLVFEPVRLKVFNCWMFHRKTVPDLQRVTTSIMHNNIKLLLFFGRYDTIIPPKLGKRFARNAGNPQSLHILECGHRLLEKHEEISRIILTQNGKNQI